MNKILIVEDEIAISDLLKIELEFRGYICEVAYDGETASNYIESKNYDLILLDVMLPKIDGYKLLEYIKQIKEIPVIFLTAKNQTENKIKGLKLGADDYITKPFEMGELAARIEAVLRRYNKCNNIQVIDDISINIAKRTAEKNGEQINLTPKEFDLLVFLIQNMFLVTEQYV